MKSLAKIIKLVSQQSPIDPKEQELIKLYQQNISVKFELIKTLKEKQLSFTQIGVILGISRQNAHQIYHYWLKRAR